MFEKEAEEAIKKKYHTCVMDIRVLIKNWQEGAEFGYNLAKEEIDYLNKHWRSEEERKANEWYKVSDNLPEMDVLVYLWNNVDDFPVVACRHIPYGNKEWVWNCKWGSGYTVSQSVGKDYLWKEIILPKLKEN